MSKELVARSGNVTLRQDTVLAVTVPIGPQILLTAGGGYGLDCLRHYTGQHNDSVAQANSHIE